MKHLLISKKSTNLKVLFGTLDEYKFRHNQLKNIFKSGKDYQLFAEPLPINDNKEITWYTEVEDKPIAFNQLTESEQFKSMEILKTKVDKMFEYINQNYVGQDKDLFLKYLKQYTEIPEYEDIHAIKTNGMIQNVVITQWGCINDSFDAKDGLIRKIELGQRAVMRFKVMYDDGFVAPNEKLIFSYDKEQLEATSDNAGIINLGEYKIYTYFTASYASDKGITQLGHYLCDNQEHVLTIPALPSMKFRIINDKGQILPGMGVIFEYNGIKNQQAADLQGMIQLARLKTGIAVSAYQIENQGIVNLKQYNFDEQSKVYDFIVPEKPVQTPVVPQETPTPITDMKFRLVDKKNRPYGSSRVQIEYKGSMLEAVTDADGRFALQNLVIGEMMNFNIFIGKKIVKLKDVRVVADGSMQ